MAVSEMGPVQGLVRRFRPVEAPPAEIGQVVVGRGDRRPFQGESEIEARLRLARYRPDGEEPGEERGAWSEPVRRLLGMDPDAVGDGRFHPVRPGGLEEVPRVYVFVHGWVPGSRGVTEEVRVENGTIPLAWDERVANVVGRTMVEAYEPLLSALAQRDPQAAVLWYSWVDQSGTDTDLFAARSSLRHTGVNGRRLAAALGELLGEGQPAVHLIGHSHGSVVATYAALSMPRPPAHLTLLDCPEDWFSRAGGAAGLLSDVLPRLQPGRGEGSTFVDAYASMFGRAYHDDPGLGDVVDVRLAPAVRKSDEASPASQAHQFPVAWYARTVADPEANGGFAWSPLHGCDTSTLGSLYAATSRGRIAEVLRWRAGQGEPLEHSVSTIDARLPELTRRSPNAALVVEMPEDAILVEFDADFARPARGTRLDVAVDGNLVCSSYPESPLPSRGRFVRVEPGRTTIQFRLVAPGYLTAAEIGTIRVVRGSAAIRNLDDSAAVARIAVMAAASGAAAALAVVGAGVLGRRLVRRVRGSAGG